MRAAVGRVALRSALSHLPRAGADGRQAILSVRSGAACDRLARRHGVTVLRAGPGLVGVPPFRSGVPWLSAAIVGAHEPDGKVGEGSMRTALAAGATAGGASLADGASLAARLASARVGGCYWADAPAAGLLDDAGAGLAVVVAGGSDGACCAMLRAAFAEDGAARTLLVAIPARRFPAALRLAQTAGCRVATAAIDPWPMLDATARLHVAADGPLGVLALIAGVPVHCHGPTWYSGHGLTTDHGAHPPASTRAVPQVAAAALLTGAGYIDPFTAQACPAGHAIDLAAEWRRICDANRKVAACVGFQFWKRRRMAQFLHDGVRAPASFAAAAPAIALAAATGRAVAAWASRMPPGLMADSAVAGVPVLRVEDGFLRSVGLGSDFMPPCSVVLDGSGLYYDPSRASDLETLLATQDFPPAMLERAQTVIGRVTQAGLTKYNVGSASLGPLPADGRRRILVTGQVSDDLSVRLGGGAASGNADLLRRVREGHPDAYVIYRPHPDVDAGHRPGAVADAEALRLADSVVRGVPMGVLIAAVDEVHTMTSLAGFEALLRGRHVVVWGRPFYAGWGLTEDMAAFPRRTRRLSVQQLAAGVLLLYPRYIDPVTLLPCPAEVLIGRLSDPAVWRPGPLVRARRLQGRVVTAWRRFAPARLDRRAVALEGVV